MKKGLTLLGLIFAICTLAGHAQIYQFYSQDFETGSPVNYSVTGNNTVQSTYYSGGSRAIKLVNSSAGQVELYLDTIDFSTNAQLNYFTLEFSHIAFVSINDLVGSNGGYIEVKRTNQGPTAWMPLSGQHYNTDDGGSSLFPSTPSFFDYSYRPDWTTPTTPNNMIWKSERFDLNNIFSGVAAADRKLQVRFVLPQRKPAPGTPASSVAGWYIDDIRMRASTQPIVAPIIKTRIFPDRLNYPSSRGAKVVADVTTTVLQGVNPDSVYIEYTVGADPTPLRAYMTRPDVLSTRYTSYIPFYGYDTLISYHIVARDNTTNNNTAYYPKSPAARNVYRNVRGTANQAQPERTTTQQVALPFPALADTRCEFMYDSVELRALGFRPGAISQLRFILRTANGTPIPRERVQIRMANMPYSNTRTSDNISFYAGDMQIVYDSAFTIDQGAVGAYKTIVLQDTFYYAGGDILMQFISHNSTDPRSLAVMTLPTANNKQSLYMTQYEASLNDNPFSNMNDFRDGDAPLNQKPWAQFFAHANLPLIYDCGICAMAYPSNDVPCNVGTDSVVVWLKNFGVSTMNAVRIGYYIDNGTPSFFDWTGTLAGGDSVRVRLSTTQQYTLGHHTIRAWVDDTITVSGNRFRDHEPYNDTVFTPFAACAGPYSGTLTIGSGANNDFISLERCLYSLSRCGISAPVTVKLPAGTYDATTIPFIPGTSATNYVLFEPATATAQVTFRRPSTSLARVATLVDMTQARSIRFNNIRFSNGRNVMGSAQALVRMGRPSSNCRFTNCTFVDSTLVQAAQAETLITTGFADSVLIERCTFYGGTTGIDVVGTAPDNRATGNIVRFNELANQVNTSISVTNQNHVLVDSNMLNNVQTNASFMLLCQYVYDNSRIVRNRIYSTTGASCLGVSDMHGTPQSFSYVANNMLLSLDEGNTNQLTTPLNIIKGSYLKVCFNSVRLRTNTHVNVAAATLGGGLINNCYFQNNVVAAFDTLSHAFAFLPSTNSSDNYVNHNCYYSTSGILNKYSGVNYSNLTNWTRALPEDVGSVQTNPLFTNSSISIVDLRSFNVLLRNVGVPIPGITDDIEGTIRNATAPSLGAYEVAPLAIDFKPEELISPEAVYCGAPTTIPVEVAIRNTGTQSYTYSAAHPITCTLYVAESNVTRTFTINRAVPADDTIHFRSNVTLSLPTGTNNTDATYHITWWVRCNQDPDNLNDTATQTVESRFAPAAPNAINQNVAYRTTATITPTNGVNTWPVSYYTSGQGRTQRSGIYWYHNIDDDTPFHYGPSYTTDTVYQSDTFYISQKRNLPLMKITEVQVSKNVNAVGRTNPFPAWMHTNTVVAVEMTNCGDYPANLEGDSLIFIMPTGNPKIWVLPNVSVNPGASLVLQFLSNTAGSDSSKTIYCPSTQAISSLSATGNYGVVYRDGHGVADAVPFNGVKTTSNWTNQHVPAAVWQGNAITIPTATTAGAYRRSWPTNAATATPTATATLWQVADATYPMHLGTAKPHLVLYHDNGCEGARGQVRINVTGVPSVDLSVDEPVVNSGCNLSTAEPVQVTVHNYGAQASSAVTVNYSLDGTLTPVCSNTISGGIPARGSVTHTFTTPINMHTAHDSLFHVKVWVTPLSTDSHHSNDSISGYFLSRHTPDHPVVTPTVNTNYDQQVTLSILNPSTTSATIWRNRFHVPVDTTMGSYTTPRIYYDQYFYVNSIGMVINDSTHVGTLAAATTNTAYPSPYNPNTRFVKEQYIYTADQIHAAGHGAGTISALSFYLENIGGTSVNEYTFSEYTIKMGTTTMSTFPTGSNPQFVPSAGLTQVFTSSNLTIHRSDIGWIQHKFSTPFDWDGTSNIVVEVFHSIGTALTSGASTRYTSQANTVLTTKHATNDVSTATTGSRSPNRPDIRFGFLEVAGCQSDMDSILVHVANLPPYDANMHWDPALDTMLISSCSTTVFNAELENSGANPINNYTIRYKFDNGSWSTVNGNAQGLTTGYTRIIPITTHQLTPGRHLLTACISVSGDTVHSNDTIRRVFNVRFCAGSYTVGPASGNDYASLQMLLDTLSNAGVAGAVTFLLDGINHTGQYTFGPVYGTSYTQPVRFETHPFATDTACIMFAPTQANNYVVNIENAKNIIFNKVNFYATYTGTASAQYTNVIRVTGSENITFRNGIIRTKKRAAFTNTSNLVLLGDNNQYVTIDHCLLDSGYYQVSTFGMGTASGHHLIVTNSDLINFAYRAIDVRNIDSVQVQSDSIASSQTANNKPLLGISIANSHNVAVKKNFIHLMDNYSGGKRGIQLYHCTGTNVDRVTVYNNMISLKGSSGGSGAALSEGIVVDSNSTYVSVYFNSVRLYAGPNKQANTKALEVSRSSRVFVLNNIFMNASMGYASYVATDTCVSLSNYNVYWNNDTVATRKYAFWGNDCPTFDSLRTRSNAGLSTTRNEINSLEREPSFTDEGDLRLRLAEFAGLAQYNSDVPDDVFDSIRPQIPPPTIGAHEFTRLMHDIAVANVIEPRMPGVTTGANPQVYNIETDSILVHAHFYNNGMAPESAHWYVTLENTNPAVRSADRPLSLPLRTDVFDSVRIPSPLGVIDSQKVVIHLVLDNATDVNPIDNEDTVDIFIYPAYNLQLLQMSYTNNTPAGCRMYQVPITYKIKNVGYKDFPGTFVFNIGYNAWCHQPSDLSLPNLPSTNSEPVSFGAGNDLPIGTDREITLTPPYQPNLFPTGTLTDITARVRGYVSFQYDVKHQNDTISNPISIQSYHTPESPVGHDTMVDYGTFANLFATQPASRPISWGQDSTGTYFYQRSNNYNQSTHWEARQTWAYAPPYIHDTTFYLCCFSTHQCTSYYSPINVSINPPLMYDVAIGQVLSPRGEVGVPPDEFLEGRVYNEVDTVKLRVVNYGSQPISNIHVAFKFMNQQKTITYLEAFDTIRATIPGRVGDNVSYYDFKFPDSVMLQLPGNPTTSTKYALNAWVHHDLDMQHNNDTLSTIHYFNTYPQTTYDTIRLHTPEESAGFDIIRVSYNTLDHEMPDMFGNTYRNFGNYNANNADVPTLYMRQGTTDTLFIEVANNLDEYDSSTGAALYVAIDYNRNGHYADGREGWKEVLTASKLNGVVTDYYKKVQSRRTYALPLTIPEYAHYGYMRMLVLVDGDTSSHPHIFPTNYGGTPAHTYSFSSGAAQEFLLFIQEPGTELPNDAALSRVSYPRKHILTNKYQNVGVVLSNKGSEPLTSATLDAQFFNQDHLTMTRTVDWAGALAPGESTVVQFDSVLFRHGTTWMVCFVTAPDDTVNHANDTIRYQYHIFDTVTLTFPDNFDDTPFSLWYAPGGTNAYNHNYFERATPAKANISSPYSAPYAMVTGPTRPVNTGLRGNRSVLYSPIFNISAIKPDTVSMKMARNLSGSSTLRMEYLNYEFKWFPLDDADVGRDDEHESWYDDPEAQVWTGSSPAGAYETKRIAINGIATDFPGFFQVRFIYEAPIGTTASTSYGDGVAIDDFSLGRARRPADCGVVDIVYPENPRFGDIVYPRVKIHNYGTAAATNIDIAYLPYGHYLPFEAVCRDTVQPDSTIEYTFPDPFVILNNFPDTFTICAFTNYDQDIYNDNDTTYKNFGLSPLDNDMQMVRIVSPTNRAVAGDSLTIRVRLRNFGQVEVEETDVAFIYNGGAPVVEHVNFRQVLGHPLGSTEMFDYIFTRRVKATMGTMELTTWVDYSLDHYRYNDTLMKQIVGISAVTDVAVTGIAPITLLDTVAVALTIENQGARMVNDFIVGFWYDNDPSLKFEERFSRDGGLPGGRNATHLFSQYIRQRSAPYIYMTGYVVVPNDHNPDNDTTYYVIPEEERISDLQANVVEVEENETDECRVRIEIENTGNMPYFRANDHYRLSAVINDTTLIRDIEGLYLEPGQVRRYLFDSRIRKDPNRHYTGSGNVRFSDADPTNNTTNLVRVVNYFEGVPRVETDNFTLSQNYPNPFDGTTRIEFNLPNAGTVTFCVTDALGRKVLTRTDYCHGGLNTISFSRDDLAAGIYYYSVEFQGKRLMKKMIVR